MFIKLPAFIALWALFSITQAHEFWLQPNTYQAEPEAEIQVHWRNGMDFQGSVYVYLPRMSTFVGTYKNGMVSELKPRFAAKPALKFYAGQGTTIGLTESTDFLVEYENLAAFKHFVEKEDLIDQFEPLDIKAGHAVFESYRRYAKTLISGIDDVWQDTQTGQHFEWLLTRQNNTLTGTLLIDGEPATNYPVKLFSKASFDAKDASLVSTRTNDNGQVMFDNMITGHQYLINAIKLRHTTPSDTQKKALWHTDWASTTFQW